jgi:uncharacterized OB-fold protein
VLQECGTCARRWHPVLPGCPYCGHQAVRTLSAGTSGVVYSWVVVEMALSDPHAAVPYTIVTVDLDAGARVFGRFEGALEPTAGARVVMSEQTRGKAPARLAFRPEET